MTEKQAEIVAFPITGLRLVWYLLVGMSQSSY
jgi:hypothetical protein